MVFLTLVSDEPLSAYAPAPSQGADSTSAPLGTVDAIIGLTANAFAEDRAACLAACMIEVLVKPVGRRALLGALIVAMQSGSVVRMATSTGS